MQSEKKSHEDEIGEERNDRHICIVHAWRSFVLRNSFSYGLRTVDTALTCSPFIFIYSEQFFCFVLALRLSLYRIRQITIHSMHIKRQHEMLLRFLLLHFSNGLFCKCLGDHSKFNLYKQDNKTVYWWLFSWCFFLSFDFLCDFIVS